MPTSFLLLADAAPTTDRTALFMFLGFVAMTLVITYFSAKKSSGSSAYFAAGRRITGWQNGLAVAGDYMSAASFLGIAGMIAFKGYDGFMYSVGWLVAYLTVLLIVAEPLRNAGKYTMADVLAYRLSPRPVRAMASLSTLTVSTFYMIAQMVGAGGIIKVLIGVDFVPAVIGVGVLMLVYVVFGGMLATTWVQIIKAVLLMGGAFALSIMVLGRHDYSLSTFFEHVSQATYAGSKPPVNLLDPGLAYGKTAANPWGAVDFISLALGLVLGTAGLPHNLVRFYTVPDAKTARVSVVWATAIIGVFYILTTFFGFGAATILNLSQLPLDAAGKPDGNMVAPILAKVLGGEMCVEGGPARPPFDEHDAVGVHQARMHIVGDAALVVQRRRDHGSRVAETNLAGAWAQMRGRDQVEHGNVLEWRAADQRITPLYRGCAPLPTLAHTRSSSSAAIDHAQ